MRSSSPEQPRSLVPKAKKYVLASQEAERTSFYSLYYKKSEPG